MFMNVEVPFCPELSFHFVWLLVETNRDFSNIIKSNKSSTILTWQLKLSVEKLLKRFYLARKHNEEFKSLEKCAWQFVYCVSLFYFMQLRHEMSQRRLFCGFSFYVLQSERKRKASNYTKCLIIFREFLNKASMEIASGLRLSAPWTFLFL